MLKNEVRIIGGKWRRRILRFPKNMNIRPTPNRVRETLFDWLSHDILQAQCLDLFAGSGALGFEALSRGAFKTIFVDKNPIIVRQLHMNCERLECCDQTEMIQNDALTYLHQTDQTFDLVFLDPPFYQNLAAPCCQILFKRDIMRSHGFLYVELESFPKKETGDFFNTVQFPPEWKILHKKQAGQIIYSLIQKF